MIDQYAEDNCSSNFSKAISYNTQQLFMLQFSWSSNTLLIIIFTNKYTVFTIFLNIITPSYTFYNFIQSSKIQNAMFVSFFSSDYNS